MPGTPDATAYAIPTGTSIVVSTSPAAMSCGNHASWYSRKTCETGQPSRRCAGCRRPSGGGITRHYIRRRVTAEFPLTASRPLRDDNRTMPISAAFDAGRFAVLEGIARGTPLGEVLDDIVRLIEAQRPGLLASILLVDGDPKCLREGAAPSLPIAYTRLLDGQPIGPKNGSCGTAAYLGQRVIVEDISTHPYWEGFAELALPHGLRACWSTPILAPDRAVIGTFAIYYRQPGKPSGIEIEWVDAATDLAAIAIAHDMSARSLRRSEARYRQLIDEAYEGVWTIDTSRRTTFANRRMGQILGEDPAALQGRLLLDFVHPDDREKVEQSVAGRLAGQSGHVEFRVRRKDGSERWVVSAASPIKNERGAVVGGLGLREGRDRAEARGDARRGAVHVARPD